MSTTLNQITIARETYFDNDGKVNYVDYGDAIIINNVVYEKCETELDTTVYTLKNEDIINIRSITFDFDDNGVLSGDCHRTWSPVEMAITYLPENNSGQWGHPNTGSQVISLDMCKENLIYEVPRSGILRVNHVVLMNSPSYVSVYVSDNKDPDNYKLRTKFPSNFYTTQTNLSNAFPVLVRAGERIFIPNFYSHVMLLPFEYNAED
jgi:hypothetical protein